MPSTVIETYEYFSEKELLRVKYRSGMVYDYKKVPPEIAKALSIAGSKGRYLNHYVKGKFEYQRII